MSDTDIQRAAAIILRRELLDGLYNSQRQAETDIRMNFFRVWLFALMYYSLWPLFQYGRLRRWSRAKARALDYGTSEMNARYDSIKRACLDAGVPDGIIPSRELFG